MEVYLKQGRDRFLVLFFIRTYFEKRKRTKLLPSIAYTLFRLIAYPGYRYRVIYPAGLNVRKTPERFGDVVGYARMGDTITSINSHPREDSLYVRIDTNKYVQNKKQYLKLIDEKPSNWCVVWCKGVSIHDSIEGKIVGHVNEYEQVTEYERKGHWMRIHKKQSLWIHHMHSVSRVVYVSPDGTTP